MFRKQFILTGIVSLGLSQMGSAQHNLTTTQLLGQVNTITTAVPFLMISPDSRAGGMGDAGVASTPDANSIHWNPAKLAFLDKKMGLSISYTPWLRALVPDINLAYLSFYYKPGSKKSDQTIASSLRYFSLGDITFTDVTGATIGQFRPYEMAYDVAYSRKLAKRFSVGMSGRYIYSNLTNGVDVGGANTHAAKTFAVDLSGFYTNDKVKVGDYKSIANFGFDISNLGGKVSYTSTAQRDFIPINARIGGALTMELDKYNSLSFIGDINKLLVPTPPHWDSVNHVYQVVAGYDNRVPVLDGIGLSLDPTDPPGKTKEYLREFDFCGGMEYWYDKMFAVRAGYFYEHPTKGNRKYFTLGAGIKYSVFTLDFAYLVPTDQRNPLQNTLRFTLVFDFDALKEQNKESGTSN
ncbi:MAG: type IX secretion system outer membrane channel protein PorV [Bacteroidia bacterium]